MKININNYVGNNQHNAMCIEINDLTIYLSYQTVIAFSDSGKLTIIKNYWSTTTGKHLNAINRDKSIRLDNDQFEKELQKLLKYHKLTF